MNAEVDWPHVIDEIHDVGVSQLTSVESFLQQAMTHLLKLHMWPTSDAVRHWRDETGKFLDEAERRFAPSMRQRIDLAKLYARARKRALDGGEAGAGTAILTVACPFVLDELLEGDLGRLTTRLAG